MSILKKPYTISVWDDVWNAATGKFEEQRVGIIGADNMLYQGKAIEPNLIRNVNGTKKFSFKMYKYFIDNETGERVENPFVDWLVSERKVKLQYKGKWYDFIVKNINENSSNYLYTYQLEDALVQELSKNGFGITLDAKLMNNMGTASELATYVLNETDWSVSSEALVEKVEDNLVYITIPAGTVVHKIIDQTDLNNGIDDSTVLTLNTQWNALAFYTSCTSKPHRFQFIYIPEGYYEEDDNGKRIPSVSTDENQIINVKDCQYYCEINTPEAKDAYVQHSTFKQFYLPEGFNIIDFGEDGISNNHDTTISVWYRGHRYGFAQDAKYIPALNRYCNVYYKNGTKYYGYVDNDYNSPVILQNIITNTDFKGTTGWVGTYSGVTPNAKGTYGVTIESVYGEFPENGNKFSSVIEQLSNGTYNSQKNYQSYLKVTFPQGKDGNQGILINTGFYDNRTSIGEVDYDEEWYFNVDIVDDSGDTVNVFTNFDFVLREVSFDPTKGSYTLGNIWATLSTKQIDGETIRCLKFNGEDKKDTYGYADVKISKKDFKKKEIKLVITPTTGDNKTYYIEDMQLFKLVLNDNAKIIKPGDLEIEGVIKTTHRFFPASWVEEGNGHIKQEAIDVEAITYENFDKTAINYSVYKPQYNQGAQKVRSVDAKESNYFNILQSIAEKFEAWLELEIGRNEQGGVTSKTVKFKNYAGKDNYASFRYGVNLKDIQRTYESKNIVTKLIVKQNNNEHAENGFCTIARAGANQTGENYIYDFRYYHDRGMLNATEYVSSLYYSQNPLLDDENTIIEQGPECTTQVITNYSGEFSTNNAFATVGYSFKKDKEYKIKLKIKTGQAMSIAVGWDGDIKDGYYSTKANEEVTLIYSITPNRNLPGHEVCLYYFGNINDITNKTFTILSLEIYQNYNLQNYFNRIKNLNVKIQDINDIIIPKQNELIKLKADLAVQEGLRNAAAEGLEEVREDFQALTGLTPETASATLIDMTSSNIQSMLTEYATYMAQYNDAKVLAGYTAENGTEVVGSLQLDVVEKETEIKQAQAEIETLVEYKKELNKLFYSRYSRFIQEGTWIDEKYIDDNKYYADAQSVMYNSCYPQAAYTINVIALSALPGYEYFDFELGDRTYAIDPEFFGEDHQEAVIINELSENLDDPSRDQIKVQNFKNQFQDLFQKITATVQQAQYSSGAYEKAVALAEANAAIKAEFLQDAFNSADDTLSKAGQTSVVWGDNGITLTDSNTKNEMRLIGGAILMSTQDENGQRKWKTGLTPEGISASLVTAGTIDTGKIQIKNGKDVTFLWNSFGISAFDVDWNNGEVVGTPDTSKFVRFDKHGIYGIDISNNTVTDGLSWQPSSADEIDESATFALTWEGFKVKNDSGVTLRIGDNAKTGIGDSNLLKVSDSEGNTTFAITNNGSIIWGSGEDSSSSPFQMLYSSERSQPSEKPENDRLWSSYPQTGTTEWHRVIQPTDWYASYTSNGGATWSVPIRIVSANTSEIIEWYYATDNANETPLGPNDTGYTATGWKAKWKPSPSEAGHSAVKKYLWNYEETKLSNGTSKYSSPALITTQPKSIDKIYEFYLVTSTASVPDKPSGFSWNGTKLTYTNTNPTWECIDTSIATSASSKHAAQSEYMWNFEVVCYDDATCTVGSIANIGTGGKGIEKVENYYLATATEAEGLSLTHSSTGWDKTIAKSGHGNDKPFLWTYEKTTYSNTTAENSNITLLARTPRTIVQITEYYQVLAASATAPTAITLKNNNNEIDDIGSWSTTYSSPLNGEALWNCEVIKFQTADDEGKNLYQVVEPAKIGYIGVDSYKISLSNDVDVIVYDNAGTLISTLPELTVYRHIGNAESTIGEVSITPPGQVWSKVSSLPSSPQASYGYYSYNSSTGVFKILKMPSSYSDGAFTFTWKSANNSVYGSAKFQFKKVTSTADYDLVIAQTVFNSGEAGGTFTISVLKKSNEGTITLTGPGSELKLYRNGVEVSTIGGTGSNKNNWAVQSYNRHEKKPITYVLKSADGSIVWDEEVIEFTQDGSGIKQIVTYIRDFPYIKTSESQYGWTTPKEGSTTAFVDIGHTETWTAVLADNTHINIGDTAYLQGTVADRYAASGVKQSITLYGKVVAVDEDGVTMTTTSVIWGGVQGVKGNNGTSPYTISLDNDFVSVPADENKNIAATWGIWIQPTIYYGDEETNWEPKSASSTAKLQLSYESANLTVVPSTGGEDYFIKELTDDVGTVNFVLYNGEKKVAETKFEAVKQIKGTHGDSGTYVYAVAEPNVLHKGNLANITIQMYERVGSGSPKQSTSTYYGTYSIDGGSPTNITLNGGSITLASNKISNIDKTLQIIIYSNLARTVVIDKITIEALEDGESVYILYHDAIASGSLNAPSNKDYNSYNATAATEGDDRWYTDQTEDSVYSVSKVCKISDQATTNWGPVTRISGVLTTYDDWFSILGNESAKGIYVLDQENGVVGVSADVIKTGALKVGNSSEPSGNKFYADMSENGSVYIAGWQVGVDRLTNGTIGSINSFGIYPLGADDSIFPSTGEDDECYKTTDFNWKGSLISGDAWVMTAGTNFGLTKNGYLYASAVKLGGGTLGSDDSIFLSTQNMTGVAGFFQDSNNATNDAINNWRLTVGSNFGVTADGSVYAKKGYIAGWKINNNSLHIGTLGQENSMWLVRDGTSPQASIAESGSLENWCIGVGKNFGVTKEGHLYAVDGHFKGSIYADGGEIGGLEIKEDSITNGDGFSITPTGITMNSTSVSIQLNSLAISNTSASSSAITNSGTLSISGSKAGLTLQENVVHTYRLYIEGRCNWGLASNTYYFKTRWKNETLGQWTSVPYTGKITVYWKTTKNDLTGYFTLSQIAGKETGTEYGESFTSGYSLYVGLESGNYSGYFSLPNATQSMGTIKMSKTYTDGTNSDGQVSCKGHFMPSGHNTYRLGSNSVRWSEIWCTQSSINSSSDLNLKKDIANFTYEYDTFFDNLKPVKYRFIENQSNRFHAGFISQWTEEALATANLTNYDFAGILKDSLPDGNVVYGLRYSEFISLNTWQIQKLKLRMASAEEKLLAYETRISNLETELENLKNSQISDII